jgi:hypothetical protein
VNKSNASRLCEIDCLHTDVSAQRESPNHLAVHTHHVLLAHTRFATGNSQHLRWGIWEGEETNLSCHLPNAYSLKCVSVSPALVFDMVRDDGY